AGAGGSVVGRSCVLACSRSRALLSRLAEPPSEHKAFTTKAQRTQRKRKRKRRSGMVRDGAVAEQPNKAHGVGRGAGIAKALATIARSVGGPRYSRIPSPSRELNPGLQLIHRFSPWHD